MLGNLKHPDFLRFGASCCIAHAFVLSYVVLAPQLLMEHWHLSRDTFTMLFSGNAFVVMLLCYATPHLIRRFGAFVSIKLV